MTLYVGDSGHLCPDQGGVLRVGDCNCTTYVPGVPCACDEGNESPVIPLDQFGGSPAIVYTQYNGECYSFDPAAARPLEAGDDITGIGETYEGCDDCCGQLVLVGVVCGCSAPAHSFQPVIPDNGSMPFNTITKIGDKCYRFPRNSSRETQSGDILFAAGTTYSTCSDCCDTIPMHPDCCDPPDERSCYQLQGSIANVSGSVTHYNRAECMPGEIQAEATQVVPMPSAISFTVGTTACDPATAGSIVSNNVSYAYNQSCNPAFPRQDTYIAEHAVTVSYTNDNQFGNPTDPEWDVNFAFRGADVTADLSASVKVVAGVITTSDPEIRIFHTRLGPSSTSFFRGNHPITFTPTVTGPCGFTMRFQWNVVDQLVNPNSGDFWSSSGDVTIAVEGWGDCQGEVPVGSRSIVRGCGSCGDDDREGAI